MTPSQIVNAISERFADRLIEVFIEDKHPRVHIPVEHWRSLAEFQHREADKLLSRLERYASLNSVPRHWR